MCCFSLRSLCSIGVLLLVTGCAVAPEPISMLDHIRRAKNDTSQLYIDQEPLTGPLTAHGAVARALKYNLENKFAMSEVALQAANFDLALVNALPRLAANAGYTTRDSENASSSLSLITGRQSLEPSTSQDMRRTSGDLSFSWNILDLGVSYFQARQQADRALIAVERRRRVINNIVKEVRSAFWRASTAQRLLPKITPLLKRAEIALKANEAIEAEVLEPVLATLEYRRNLLQVIGQLRRLESDLSMAKSQLASLIGLPPSSTFTVVESKDDSQFPRTINADVASLELMGLTMRPELREEAYLERIDRNNLRKEVLRLMPGVSLLSSLNFDSNSFLTNHFWAEAGIRATFNLVSLIQLPNVLEAAEAQIEVAQARRLALNVAVLTQINVSYQQFMRAVEGFGNAREIAAVEARIERAAQAGGLADAEPEFEQIRRGLAAMAAELDRDRTYTELQSALANLYTSIGLEPMPPSFDTESLASLTEAVRLSLQDLERGRIKTLPSVEQAAQPAQPVQPDSPQGQEMPPLPPPRSSPEPGMASKQPGTEEGAVLAPAPRPGNWRVQLASVYSMKDALSEWGRFNARYPEVMSPMTLHVAQSPGTNGRVVYRVIGDGIDEAGAHEVCKMLPISAATGCHVLPPASKGRANSQQAPR